MMNETQFQRCAIHRVHNYRLRPGSTSSSHFTFASSCLLRLYPVRIGDAAIDGANGRALRLVVERYAFGAFIGHDIKIVRGEKSRRRRSARVVVAPKFCPPSVQFALPPSVDRIVRAFRLACTAVDAFGRNHNGHIDVYLLLDHDRSRISNARN